MVETGGLENRCTGNRTGGSNPSPSAISLFSSTWKRGYHVGYHFADFSRISVLILRENLPGKFALPSGPMLANSHACPDAQACVELASPYPHLRGKRS